MNFKNEKLIAVILGDPRLPDPIKRGGKFNSEDLETVEILKQALAKLTDYKFIFLDNHQNLFEDLKNLQPQIYLVFNLCDEGYMNDPIHEDAVPIFLGKLNLRYTGADARCMRLCYNKERVLILAEANGVPIPKSYDQISSIDSYPVLVKPTCGDGGIGITTKSIIFNQSLLSKYLKEWNKKFPNNKPLIQEFLPGSDLSLGIIGNPPKNFEILPITRDDYSKLPKHLPPISGYEAKWLPDSVYWKKVKTVKADLNEREMRIIIANSIKMFALTFCRDYARFDWRLDAKGNPKLLEVNPNPGWCWDGHLAKMSNYGGLTYEQMLLSIIKAAEVRYGLK